MEERLKYSLSDKDIMKIIGDKAEMITYDKLRDINNIDDLFSNGIDKIVLLYVHQINGVSYNGHWSCLLKTKIKGKTHIEFNDSYGLLPDKMLESYTKEWRRKSNQDRNYLNRLLYEASLRPNHIIEYNEVCLQSKSPNIATCGRYVGLRGRFYKIPLATYQSIFKDLRKRGFDLDKVVVLLTDQFLF